MLTGQELEDQDLFPVQSVCFRIIHLPGAWSAIWAVDGQRNEACRQKRGNQAHVRDCLTKNWQVSESDGKFPSTRMPAGTMPKDKKKKTLVCFLLLWVRLWVSKRIKVLQSAVCRQTAPVPTMHQGGNGLHHIRSFKNLVQRRPYFDRSSETSFDLYSSQGSHVSVLQKLKRLTLSMILGERSEFSDHILHLSAHNDATDSWRCSKYYTTVDWKKYDSSYLKITRPPQVFHHEAKASDPARRHSLVENKDHLPQSTRFSWLSIIDLLQLDVVLRADIALV